MDPSLADKYVGKTLAQIAEEEGKEPFTSFLDLLKADSFSSTILSVSIFPKASVIDGKLAHVEQHVGDEGNIRKIMRHSRHTGIAIDAFC